MNNEFRKVSIIIPTYNRADKLGITLESCVNQTYPQDCFEILVADNNSTDNTKKVIEDWISKSPVPIKYILDTTQGAHSARNKAAKISDSSILYFTDDDIILDKDVLTNIVKVFDLDYNIAVAGGRVLPKWEFDPPEWLLKYFPGGPLSLISKSEKLIVADYDPGIYSCHQAMLREVLFECGGFNPDIVKNKLVGNGETGLNIKILEAGYNFAYVSDAVAYHMIPRSRMTQKYLNSRLGNQGNCDGFTVYRSNENSKKVLLKLIFFSHIPAIFRRLVNSGLRQAKKDDRWRFDRAYFYYYLHRLSFDLKLILSRNWREYVVKYDYMNEI